MLPRTPLHRRRARALAAGVLLAALPLAFGACALLESTEEKSPSQAFITPDGVTEYDINGTWRGPCLPSGDNTESSQWLLDFLAKDLVLVRLDWNNGDDCSGNPATVTQHEGKFSVNGTKEVGWDPAAPFVLPDPVTASTFTHDLRTPADFGGGEVSQVRSVGLAVDTASPVVLYIGGGFDPGIAIGGDGYPSELSDDPYYRD